MAFDRYGPAWDRRCMVVDPKGRFMTARTFPRLLRVQPALTPEGVWVHRACPICFAVANPGKCRHTRDRLARCPGCPRGWCLVLSLVFALSETECRLVFANDPQQRRVDTDWFSGEHAVSFADGFPVLLVNRGSLDDLNRRMPAPLEMARFRANIEVEGFEPFAEDQWASVQAGSVLLKICKPCSRCVLTTVNPATLEKGWNPSYAC